MDTKRKKSAYAMTREQERAASRVFGRHVSPAKALSSLIAALLCCASPMLLGLRLWELIPPVVQTGLVSAEGLDAYHIEVKRVERLNIGEAMKQAERDAAGRIPVVMHRRSRQPWLVTLHLADFLKKAGGNP